MSETGGNPVEFLRTAGAAVNVAEAAVELRDFLTCFDEEEVHWWTVRYSDEFEELMRRIEDYELACQS